MPESRGWLSRADCAHPTITFTPMDFTEPTSLVHAGRHSPPQQTTGECATAHAARAVRAPGCTKLVQKGQRFCDEGVRPISH